MKMEEHGSNHSHSSTASNLKLHRPLPGNSLASSSSTLFESSVDDPVLPWWEAEAENTLRGNNLQAIRLLYRYRTYEDSSIPASILRTNWTPTLDAFLHQLTVETCSRHDVDDLDLDQKVKMLLKWLEPSRPADRNWWHPPIPAMHLNASDLASELNEQSWLLFRDITFSDFVREALYPGETVEPIETFKDWHDSLFHEILDYLARFPAEEEKFVQVQQVSTIVLTSSLY